MSVWQVQEVRTRLSEVIEEAKQQRPAIHYVAWIGKSGHQHTSPCCCSFRQPGETWGDLLLVRHFISATNLHSEERNGAARIAAAF